jgi:hypothetical protein
VLFGFLVSSVTEAEFHWPFTATWVIFMIVAAVVIEYRSPYVGVIVQFVLTLGSGM